MKVIGRFHIFLCGFKFGDNDRRSESTDFISWRCGACEPSQFTAVLHLACPWQERHQGNGFTVCASSFVDLKNVFFAVVISCVLTNWLCFKANIYLSVWLIFTVIKLIFCKQICSVSPMFIFPTKHLTKGKAIRGWKQTLYTPAFLSAPILSSKYWVNMGVYIDINQGPVPFSPDAAIGPVV